MLQPLIVFTNKRFAKLLSSIYNELRFKIVYIKPKKWDSSFLHIATRQSILYVIAKTTIISYNCKGVS